MSQNSSSALRQRDCLSRVRRASTSLSDISPWTLLSLVRTLTLFVNFSFSPTTAKAREKQQQPQPQRQCEERTCRTRDSYPNTQTPPKQSVVQHFTGTCQALEESVSIESKRKCNLPFMNAFHFSHTGWLKAVFLG